MKFNEVLKETTFFTHGGGKKTKHDPKRSKFASKKVKKGKNIHKIDYEKALKSGDAYGVWIHKVRGKI